MMDTPFPPLLQDSDAPSHGAWRVPLGHHGLRGERDLGNKIENCLLCPS